MNEIELPTAAEVLKYPPDFRAKIARKSRNKGSNYEREVAKKIAAYFGWNWNDAFIRTSPHAYAQPDGDLKPINEMRNLWVGAKLGPLECKNRATWAFDQLFKTPEKSELYKYWRKSNEDTKSDNTVLIFTKNAVQDYTMCLKHNIPSDCVPSMSFCVGENEFRVVSLKLFLLTLWPK